MKSFYKASVLVDKVSVIWLFTTVTHSGRDGLSPLLSRKVSLHIFCVCYLRTVIEQNNNHSFQNEGVIQPDPFFKVQWLHLEKRLIVHELEP